MINWFDMPAEGLSNGGLFEVKELEVTENGTYETKGEMYNKVIVNVEGGGGSWQTVFEGSVETIQNEEGTYAGGTIEGLPTLVGDIIKVTFNGTEYELPKTQYGYGTVGQSGPEFSEYPLFISTAGNPYMLFTQTAGTYTLKIEEQQSGGSSDFSTAEVTFISVSNTYGANATTVDNDGIKHETYEVSPQNPVTVTVPLYKGKNILPITCIQGNDESYMPTTEGSVVFDLDSFGYIVTGNGSITAKGRSIG